MAAGFPPFRTGNALATTFTGTVTERHGAAVERVPTPARLVDWFRENGLAVGSCTPAQLDLARELREAIHAAATAVAAQGELPAPAVHLINDCATHGRAAPHLTAEGTLEWRLGAGSVPDALSVIAADAISIVSGERDGRVALCASPTCRAAFLDTSRGRTRRWCDMNTCGNREKKARFKAGQRTSPGPTD
jgi:predicted RNA-binding Zn ribbon-like protein